MLTRDKDEHNVIVIVQFLSAYQYRKITVLRVAIYVHADIFSKLIRGKSSGGEFLGNISLGYVAFGGQITKPNLQRGKCLVFRDYSVPLLDNFTYFS